MLSKIITKSSRMSNARLFFYYLWPIPQKIGGEGDCHYNENQHQQLLDQRRISDYICTYTRFGRIYADAEVALSR